MPSISPKMWGELRPLAAQVLIIIICNSKRRVSIAELMQITGNSKRAICYALAELRQAGHVERGATLSSDWRPLEA